MSLLTIAAIEIGKAVTKSIFKFWLKDSALGEDISSSLIDLVGSKTSDALAQRKGHRQFEAVGDKISEDILPLLESEGIHLDEGSRKSVALAAAETLNKSRISKDLLLKQNLQPTQLEQYMLATNPNVTQIFSEAEIFLYQSIIKECCTYIVDISSQLPSFTEHTFAEILKREDLISAKVDQVLDELCKMREQLDPTNEVDRFEKEYREAVARNLDILQLIGADVSLPNRRHKLSVAYITLSVAQKIVSPTSIAGSFVKKSKSVKKSKGQPVTEVVPTDTALASSPRLLIRGLAGSGKTTLLQWVAVRAATRSFEGQLSSWNGIIPFYIRLRHYAQSRLPKPEAFLDYVAPAIAGAMPEKWVHKVLRSGHAILLIDGVDEVAMMQREEVYTWLRDLVETYVKARFIITSRPHAIEEGWMNHETFNDATLQELDLADIFLFIDHWHEAVKQELLTDEEKNELYPLAKHLKERVRQTRTIRSLATNPLLCAMLCALNRERRQHLPVNRIELYEACCTLLLERREKESRIDLSDYPLLNYGQKRRLLEDLAYWMTMENLSVVETPVVDERFMRKLANMPNIPPDTSGKAVRKLLVERSGIIREPVAGQIDFTHRTFQEYFTAQEAVGVMNIKQLVTNAHNDLWREVIILAAGLAASKAMSEQLVMGLIKRGDDEIRYCYQLHLIAVSCLETSIELGPEVRENVEQRLSRLVPPENMEDAKALSAAGELAVRHLVKKGELNAEISAACIHALAIIGGDIALEVLEGYADDSREIVVDELLRAWDDFDRETYAKRVLSKTFQNRSELRLSHLTSEDKLHDLINLVGLPNVTSLNMSGCSQLRSLSLTDLPNLTSLNLLHCSELNSLSLLDLPKLTSLNLSGCSRLSSPSLTDLPKLTSLNLSGCSGLSSLMPLTELPNLISLNLSGCSGLSSLMPLTELPNLISLSLSDCSQFRSLSLTDLPNLASLDLSGCSQLRSLSLTDLPNLTSLNLLHCSELNSLSLLDLPKLTSLNLSGCSRLSSPSLTDLPKLTSLKLSHHLNLSILSLSSLSSLPTLDLSHCYQLSSLNLTDLPGLSTLRLISCFRLRTLSLTGLPNLISLDLSGCTLLSDLTSLVGLPHLEELILKSYPEKWTLPPNIPKKVRINRG